MEQVAIGVIGGSGLYQMPEITDRRTVEFDTPFGKPSAPIVLGTLRGKRVAFLPRHGNGHIFTPSTVPYRANICALKMMGVRHIFAVNACGSLREDYAPGDVVIPDQLYDMTKHDRGNSFFATGMVAHISVADPFCSELSRIACDAVTSVGATAHMGGCFVTVEGPRFSTRGESTIYRKLGCDIIGMTTCPEAFLAREAEIAYTVMAHITDYDVWHVSEAPVTVEMVIATLQNNVVIAQQALAEAVASLPENQSCSCHNSLEHATMTHPDAVPVDVLDRMKPIAGRLFA